VAFTNHSGDDSGPALFPGVTTRYVGTAFEDQLRAEERIKKGWIRNN
jgi:hypothetical protein